jgi:hypothetical protein
MFIIRLSNKVKALKVVADSLQDAEKHIINKYLINDGDHCMITTPTGRIVTIEKDSTFKARFYSGYKFHTCV